MYKCACMCLQATTCIFTIAKGMFLRNRMKAPQNASDPCTYYVKIVNDGTSVVVLHEWLIHAHFKMCVCICSCGDDALNFQKYFMIRM